MYYYRDILVAKMMFIRSVVCLFVYLSIFNHNVFGRTYGRCELAWELLTYHNFPQNQLSTWLCIIDHSSKFETSHSSPTCHGIFELCQGYWCEVYYYLSYTFFFV